MRNSKMASQAARETKTKTKKDKKSKKKKKKKSRGMITSSMCDAKLGGG